jgi:hypothetical protein
VDRYKASSSELQIIIVYNKFEEVYVAPKDNEELVSALLAVNPG